MLAGEALPSVSLIRRIKGYREYAKVGGKSIDNRTLSYVANRMKAFSGGRGVLGNIENVNNTVVEITVRVIY